MRQARSAMHERGYKLATNPMDRGAVKRMQDELLRTTVSYVAERSEFYRERLGGSSIRPRDIQTVEDIENLPLTSKEDIQTNNWAFLCVDRSEVSEVVATTGTTGEPVFFAMTGGDLERLAENEMRSFIGMGIGKEDIVQIAVTLDNLFGAGLAYYSGLKKIGAGIIRIGPQHASRQLELLRTLGPTVIVAVPSFMLHLAEIAERSGMNLEGLRLGKALLIGEAVRNRELGLNNIGTRVEATWGIEGYSTYGITEAAVAFTECTYHRGLHSHPDFAYVEVIDEEGKTLGEGEVGELVITTFKVEGMPLLRYRTGDITFMVDEECPCGATTQRIGPILGRKAQKLKVKGTTVYPEAIKNALCDIKDVVNYQIVAYTGNEGGDRIVLKIGSENRAPSFLEEIRLSVRSVARVAPEIEVLTPKEIECLVLAGERRKKMTFVDKRRGLNS
ncbi:MAG: phenylacetate--CoA ligase family protein [Thermodesulfobacteriota bacterium]